MKKEINLNVNGTVSRVAADPEQSLLWVLSDVLKLTGTKFGCGELPVVPTVSAICNAVYRAIGVRFYTLPLTPERVLAALAYSTKLAAPTG